MEKRKSSLRGRPFPGQKAHGINEGFVRQGARVYAGIFWRDSDDLFRGGPILTFALAIYLQNCVPCLTQQMHIEQNDERSVARDDAMKYGSWLKKRNRIKYC